MPADLVKLGTNCWEFSKSSQLQSCIISFLVGFQQNKSQERHLRKCFEKLDRNNDGTLTLEELKMFEHGILAN